MDSTRQISGMQMRRRVKRLQPWKDGDVRVYPRGEQKTADHILVEFDMCFMLANRFDASAAQVSRVST